MTAPDFRAIGIDQAAPSHKRALIDCRTGQRTSFGELSAQARGFASLLVRRSQRQGEVVAIVLDNGAAFAAAYHGALLAGMTVQPLDPLAPPAEWERAIGASQARWLVAPPSACRQLTELPGARSVARTVVVEGSGEERERPDWIPWSRLAAETDAPAPPTPQAVPEAVAVLASSSGTQGHAKQVILTHHNLAANLEQIHARHRLAPDDVVLAVTPWRHIYGMQMALNHTLRTGGTLVVTGSPFSFEEFLRAIQEHHVTVAYLVPQTVAQLATHPAAGRYDLSSLRRVFSGGAPLAPATADACSRRLKVSVQQGYGMTEAGCTHLTPDSSTAPAGSVGLPLPGTDVRIAHPSTGEALPAGEEGELWVRGPQISPGYLPGEQTSPPLRDHYGWLHTGDLALVDRIGHCTITGRLKELIKYNGHQVAPAELEAVLLTHTAVADAAVVGVPHPAYGEIPKAFVVLRETVALSELTDYVRERVPPQRRIRAIEAVDALPRNQSGKLLRRELVTRTRRPAEDLSSPSLNGRTVLITGASRGLGRFLTDAFAEAGAQLVLTARDSKALDETAAELRSRQVRVVTAPADLTDAEAVAEVVERAVAAFGTIDVLINNAGIPGPLGPVWEADPQHWWRTMHVNILGTTHTCRSVVPVMIAARSGCVINIVSEAGRHRWPYASAYSVSKAAVIKLTENLAAELRPHHVAAFSFHPGLLDLGVTRDHLARHPTGDPWADQIGQWLVTQRDQGRFTPPEHAARALLRLVAEHARFPTGHYLTPQAVDSTLSPDQDKAAAPTHRERQSER
ncbi:SDR family NAD(P)-dependent oxidoreductase [Streptomyces griseobrunneus]